MVHASYASASNVTTTTRILTVTDLHQLRVLYDGLQKAVERHKPQIVALVGDAIDANLDQYCDIPKAECARRLASLPCALGDEIWYLHGRESVPLETDLWFPQILRRFGPASRTLWLMHEPPRG